MSDWNRARREDYIEPAMLPKDQADAVAQCKITDAEGYKTWKSVYRDDALIGFVRVRLGGESECKLRMGVDPTYCGDIMKLNSADNRYSLAVLGLLDMQAQANA